MDAKKACLAHGINLKVEKYAHREYQKYEFCKAVDCRYHYPENVFEGENCAATGKKECPYTAKEFHHWLNDSGFEIVKKA